MEGMRKKEQCRPHVISKSLAWVMDGLDGGAIPGLGKGWRNSLLINWV